MSWGKPGEFLKKLVKACVSSWGLSLHRSVLLLRKLHSFPINQLKEYYPHCCRRGANYEAKERKCHHTCVKSKSRADRFRWIVQVREGFCGARLTALSSLKPYVSALRATFPSTHTHSHCCRPWAERRRSPEDTIREITSTQVTHQHRAPTFFFFFKEGGGRGGWLAGGGLRRRSRRRRGGQKYGRPLRQDEKKKKNSKEKEKKELFGFKSHARNVRQLWPLCAEEKINKNSPSLLKSVVFSFSFFFSFLVSVSSVGTWKVTASSVWERGERRGNSISALVFPPLLSQPERERQWGEGGGERETIATRERERERERKRERETMRSQKGRFSRRKVAVRLPQQQQWSSVHTAVI